MKIRLNERDVRDLGWAPFAWLVYLIFYFVPLVAGHPTTRELVWSLVALAVFLPLYFEGFRSRGPRQLAIAWIIHGIGLAIVPINPAGGCFFIYAISFVAFAARPRQAFAWLGLMLLSMTAQALWLGTPGWGWLPIACDWRGRRCLQHPVRRDAAEGSARCAWPRRPSRRWRGSPSASASRATCTTCSGTRCRSSCSSRSWRASCRRATRRARPPRSGEVERISRDALARSAPARSRGYRADGLRRRDRTRRARPGRGGHRRDDRRRSRSRSRRTRKRRWRWRCGKPSPTCPPRRRARAARPLLRRTAVAC